MLSKIHYYEGNPHNDTTENGSNQTLFLNDYVISSAAPEGSVLDKLKSISMFEIVIAIWILSLLLEEYNQVISKACKLLLMDFNLIYFSLS